MQDLIADIMNGGQIFAFSEHYLMDRADIAILREQTKSVLSGAMLTLGITIPYQADACILPIDGVSPDGSVTTYAQRGVLRVTESDNSPNVKSVNTIIVPNGSLTDDGDGQVTLDFATGGGASSFSATVSEAGAIVVTASTPSAVYAKFGSYSQEHRR